MHSSTQNRPMTLDEAAKWLGMPGKSEVLRDWALRGKIRYFRPTNGVYLFTEDQLWEFLQSREHRPCDIKRQARSCESSRR